jgi:hypothetical protein
MTLVWPPERFIAGHDMNRQNILPYDGHAYLIHDTEGACEWPEITTCLAETVPWRIETARLFGQEMPVPEDDGGVRRGGSHVQWHPSSSGAVSGDCSIAARTGGEYLRRIIQRSSIAPMADRRRW